MKKRLRTVDWLIYITAFLDIVVLLLLLLLPCCNRRMDFVQPGFDTDEDLNIVEEVEPVNSEEDVSQAIAVGNSGNLKITLLWDFPGDIDLHVIQPTGREIYYRHPTDNRTGGYLDVDNTVGGEGSAENIYYESPVQGNYKIYLKYFSSSSADGVTGSGTCRVVIFQRGYDAKTYNIHMDTVGSEKYVTSLTVR